MSAPGQLISVIVPCYNQARFLREAIDSLLAQTYSDWEAIIVDDGSPDDAALVASELVGRAPPGQIRLLRQPNAGLASARNSGVRAARGTYILPLDSDDAIAPEMLATTAQVLDARPEVGFVYTDVQRFGEDHSLLRTRPYSRDHLRFDCLMLPMTLFRRSAWAQVGGFRSDMAIHGYEDWDFWLRLAAAGWEGAHIARTLVRYRRVGGSMVTYAQRHDLELRADIIAAIPTLYEPALRRWAGVVRSPGWSRSGALARGRWWLAYVWYAALIARYRPALLPRLLGRPLFWRLPVAYQGRLRGLLH